MKVIMYPAVSIDGFIAKPDGDSYSWVNPADEARYDAVVQEYGCVLAGSRTYHEYQKDFDSKVGVTAFICTNNPNVKDTHNVRFVHGRPQNMLQQVMEAGFETVILCGGGDVNGMFAEANLVDEMYVSIQPAVLGEGIPLFGSHKPELTLELISSNEDIPGVIQNHYRIVK